MSLLLPGETSLGLSLPLPGPPPPPPSTAHLPPLTFPDCLLHRRTCCAFCPHSAHPLGCIQGFMSGPGARALRGLSAGSSTAVWPLAKDLTSLYKYSCLEFQCSSGAQTSGQWLACRPLGRPRDSCRRCPGCTSTPAPAATSASHGLPGVLAANAQFCASCFPRLSLPQVSLRTPGEGGPRFSASLEPGWAWAQSGRPACSSSGERMALVLLLTAAKSPAL